MRAKAISDEILYPDEPIVTVDRTDVDTLVGAAARARRARSRLCTHRDVADKVHEMLIVHPRGTYVRPHCHPGKSESLHLIAGAVDIVFFDEHGGISRVIAMGDYASGKPFYYRIADPLYHTLLIRSEVLVFHETTSGPFNRAETVFASWAPDEADRPAVDRFLAALEGTIAGGGR